MLNIKSLILVLLNNLSSNYNRWKVIFLNTLDKYKGSNHVLANVTPVTNAD
jgi:hypothetical protein